MSDWRQIPWAQPLLIDYNDRNGRSRRVVVVRSKLLCLLGQFIGEVHADLTQIRQWEAFDIYCHDRDIIQVQAYTGTRESVASINEEVFALGVSALPQTLDPEAEAASLLRRQQQALSNEFRVGRSVCVIRPGSTDVVGTIKAIHSNGRLVEVNTHNGPVLLLREGARWQWQ
jgi:hypothetical protein